MEKVGLLPEEYFFSYEEYDYSVTIRRAGYKLYYIPTFVTYHKWGGSHRQQDPKYIYIKYRSKLIFQQKFLPILLWPIWLSAFYLYAKFVAPWLFSRISARKSGNVNGIVFALNSAIKDHVRNGIMRLVEEDIVEFEKRLVKHGLYKCQRFNHIGMTS